MAPTGQMEYTVHTPEGPSAQSHQDKTLLSQSDLLGRNKLMPIIWADLCEPSTTKSELVVGFQANHSDMFYAFILYFS